MIRISSCLLGVAFLLLPLVSPPAVQARAGRVLTGKVVSVKPIVVRKIIAGRAHLVVIGHTLGLVCDHTAWAVRYTPHTPVSGIIHVGSMVTVSVVNAVARTAVAASIKVLA